MMQRNDNKSKKTDYEILLYMMHVAFVEIRAAKSQSAARKFADVFHNAPMKMLGGLSQEEVLENVFDRARRNGLEEYISHLHDDAAKRFADTRSD